MATPQLLPFAQFRVRGKKSIHSACFDLTVASGKILKLSSRVAPSSARLKVSIDNLIVY